VQKLKKSKAKKEEEKSFLLAGPSKHAPRLHPGLSDLELQQIS